MLFICCLSLVVVAAVARVTLVLFGCLSFVVAGLCLCGLRCPQNSIFPAISEVLPLFSPKTSFSETLLFVIPLVYPYDSSFYFSTSSFYSSYDSSSSASCSFSSSSSPPYFFSSSSPPFSSCSSCCSFCCFSSSFFSS